MLPSNRASRGALALSLLLHALLVTPVGPRWGAGAAPPAVRPPAPDRIAFRFVDPAPAPEAPPEAPTDLVSTRNSRAAQPEAPPEQPAGAAYREGRAPVPTTPRPAGERTPAAAGPAEGAPVPVAPPERAPGQGDPRLALAPAAPGRQAPAAGARLPAPEVDQRLTRATAGSAFSLNTTAWEYAPYMARLKARIEAHIFPPPAFYYGAAGWATRARFRIAPDGRLTALELLDHRGVRNLQYVALDAIRGGADYEPLPPGFPASYLEITGSFFFNVLPDGPPAGERR